MSYEEALGDIKKILETTNTTEQALTKVVEYLHDNFSHYSWVGIYLLEGDELVLGPWKGTAATQHTRIPVGEGICGAAAKSGTTEIVPDVSKDPRYIACFLDTKSEIVVPIKKSDKIIGEIDIDSDRISAFSEQDAKFLENVAALIANKVLRA